jgi:hypothetical protein
MKMHLTLPAYFGLPALSAPAGCRPGSTSCRTGRRFVAAWSTCRRVITHRWVFEQDARLQARALVLAHPGEFETVLRVLIRRCSRSLRCIDRELQFGVVDQLILRSSACEGLAAFEDDGHTIAAPLKVLAARRVLRAQGRRCARAARQSSHCGRMLWRDSSASTVSVLANPPGEYSSRRSGKRCKRMWLPRIE